MMWSCSVVVSPVGSGSISSIGSCVVDETVVLILVVIMRKIRLITSRGNIFGELETWPGYYRSRMSFDDPVSRSGFRQLRQGRAQICVLGLGIEPHTLW